MKLYQNLVDQEMISHTLEVILLCNYPINSQQNYFFWSCSVGDSLWREIQPNLLFSSEEGTQLSSLLFSLSLWMQEDYSCPSIISWNSSCWSAALDCIFYVSNSFSKLILSYSMLLKCWYHMKVHKKYWKMIVSFW